MGWSGWVLKSSCVAFRRGGGDLATRRARVPPHRYGLALPIPQPERRENRGSEERYDEEGDGERQRRYSLLSRDRLSLSALPRRYPDG